MNTPRLMEWLFGSRLRGKQAVLCALVSVGLPTLLRQSVDELVSGLAFTFYFPFVLLAAMLLRPTLAAFVSLLSVAVVDFMFLEPRFSLVWSKTAILGIAAFLAFSAIAILIAVGIRRELTVRSIRADRNWKGIVFSSSDGKALASWYDGPSHVPLGPEEEVAEMMEDFLAQVELGKRLNGGNCVKAASPPPRPHARTASAIRSR